METQVDSDRLSNFAEITQLMSIQNMLYGETN